MSENNKKLRGNSIARRLNAALTRRSFAKTLLIDLLVACLVMATWCFTVENSHGGFINVSDRKIVIEGCDVVYNTREMWYDIKDYAWEIRYGIDRPNIDWTLPFDGVYYTFQVRRDPEPASIDIDSVPEVYYETETYSNFGYYIVDGGETVPVPTIEEVPDDPFIYRTATEAAETVLTEPTEPTEPQVTEDTTRIADETSLPDDLPYRYYSLEPTYETVKADASVILTLTVGGMLLAMILQSLSAIIKSFAGGGLIKRYLRPIDDIALMAEHLSSESHVTTESAVINKQKPNNGKSDIEQYETKFDLSDVAELTDALDEIDDSRKRIDIQAPELSGLEAAVNNMLKRLEEGRRKQIRFVDDASHELRTPIAVIQGYANMLDRWGKDDPKIRDEAIEAIKNESEHIKTLLDQLLFLARGEMDRHVLELKPVSIDEILCEVVEESQMLDKRHTYEISLASGEALDDDILENDVLILADVAMIKQSVRILCDNAVKYTPEGGTISLKSSEKVSVDEKGKVNREVCIDVSDTGIGISAEELPRIFDRFYRGQNVRGDNTGGSGLGLSIARWIIEQHHGRIEAISSPGFGTKMTIILPEYEIKE